VISISNLTFSVCYDNGKESLAGSLLNLGFVQGVDQAKKELVINGLEKKEAHTFLPILIFLAYIYARIWAVRFILLKKAWAGPRPIIILQAILQL
jgi:hypothetical protein